MRAVIVIESCFGNTAALGDAIANGLRARGVTVELFAADTAPQHIDADLVIVGAPTHSFGLPSIASRSQAELRGAKPGAGVREWLGSELNSELDIKGRILAFASTSGGRFSGSAGAAIVKQLKRKRIIAERGPDFLVTDVVGPLAECETERAQNWAASLVEEPPAKVTASASLA
jgi:hypothetical protein